MKAHQYLKNHTNEEITASDYEVIAGEKIQNWVDNYLAFNDEFTRDQNEEDQFDGELGWVFNQRGQRLFSSYLSKVEKLGYKLFPNEVSFEIEQHTGIIYP